MNRVLSFLSYYAKAKTVQNLHSPLAYVFASEVLENTARIAQFEKIEQLRKLFLKDPTVLRYQDAGKGSKMMKDPDHKVKEIARHSLSSPAQCRQLYHLVRWTGSKNILELGTSLGISILYLSAYQNSLKVHTIEASEPIANIAMKAFEKLKRTNIQLHLGRFSQKLPDALKALEQVDFAFIDGHHDGSACLKYFELIQTYCHAESIIAIDDIYWSDSMHSAWKQIKQLPDVRMSIDLFHYGLVFFNPKIQEKKELVMIPKIWKPFQIPW